MELPRYQKSTSLFINIYFWEQCPIYWSYSLGQTAAML